nr:hypothetical protein [Synergistaceae bacterium]
MLKSKVLIPVMPLQSNTSSVVLLLKSSAVILVSPWQSRLINDTHSLILSVVSVVMPEQFSSLNAMLLLKSSVTILLPEQSSFCNAVKYSIPVRSAIDLLLISIFFAFKIAKSERVVAFASPITVL